MCVDCCCFSAGSAYCAGAGHIERILLHTLLIFNGNFVDRLVRVSWFVVLGWLWAPQKYLMVDAARC